MRFYCLALLAVFGARADTPYQFSFDETRRVWSIDNGRMRATFRLDDAGHFSFDRIVQAAGGREWTYADVRSSPIELAVDDKLYGASTLYRLVSQFAEPVDRGYEQTIVLRDLEERGEVTLNLQLFENQPVMRYSVTFANLRPVTARVRSADFLHWMFADPSGNYRAFYVNQWVQGGRLGNFQPFEVPLDPGAQPVVVHSGAYGQHCGWLALRDGSDNGLFAGWEFDGRATVSASHDADDRYVLLSGVIDDLNHPVLPGETFELPAAFVGLFQGDWEEAGYRTQRFAEAAVAHPSPGADFPYVIWDSWMYQTGLDEDTLRRNAEIAAQLGIEVFVVDLGWARQIGNWYADSRKFPSGLRALSDYVHSLGMKFGLHFPFAEAMQDSPVLRAHPDWTSSVTYGYFDALSLCLSHQPVREWVVAQAVRMIDDYGVDWILQDGENMVKECTKRSHTHAPLDSNYSNSKEGLNVVVSAVQAQRPSVHWENCEDGGNMMTYNMVRRYVTSIAADDSGPLTTRQAVYGITYPFPPRYSDRYMPNETLDAYTTRSFMFGGPWIFMNRLPMLRSEDLDLAKSEIALYKKLRGRIRDGKVFHLTGRPIERGSDALESYDPSTDTAVVFVYRGNIAGNPVIKPRGLTPDRSYRVRFQTDRRNLTFTGDQLMETGVQPLMRARWTADIIYIEPLVRR